MVIGAPSIMPAGIANMFTTQCSKPMATKAMIGNHAATILPITERETSASTEPRLTIQLHRRPLIKAVAQPAPPACIYGTTLASATAATLAPTGSGAEVKNFVLVAA